MAAEFVIRSGIAECRVRAAHADVPDDQTPSPELLPAKQLADISGDVSDDHVNTECFKNCSMARSCNCSVKRSMHCIKPRPTGVNL